MQTIKPRLFAFAFSVFAYAAFGLSLIYLIAFLVGYEALPVTVDRGPVTAPWLAALVDLALIAAFGLQHSVMARRRFKQWWTEHVPASVERSVYVLISSATTIALCLAWHPITYVIWQAESALSLILWWSAFAAGFGILIAASFQLDHWELLGLKQTWTALRGANGYAADFSERGFYRLVRHPIYVGWLLLFWVTPNAPCDSVRRARFDRRAWESVRGLPQTRAGPATATRERASLQAASPAHESAALGGDNESRRGPRGNAERRIRGRRR
jgi:protein-S-isoprenylcysteine O-methyltransferase Ste14